MKIINSKKGFTLVEMVVVVAVISILMVASVEMFASMYSLSIRTNDSRIVLQEARYALDTITRESRDSVELNPTINPSVVNLKSKKGESVEFSYICTTNCDTSEEYGRIVMDVTDINGISQPLKYLTSENVEVVQFDVSFQSAGEVNHNWLPISSAEYPFFEIIIKVRGKSLDRTGQKSIVTLRTAVTRNPYSDYTYCDLFECSPSLLFVALNTTTSPNFYSYNTLEEVWTPRATPAWSGTPQKIVSLLSIDNSTLYAFTQPNRAIMKYDIPTNSWSRVLNGLPVATDNKLEVGYGWIGHSRILLFDATNMKYLSVLLPSGSYEGNLSFPGPIYHGWAACSENEYGDYVTEANGYIYMSEVCNNNAFGRFTDFAHFESLSPAPTNTKTLTSDKGSSIYSFSLDNKISVYNGTSWTDVLDDSNWVANVGVNFYYSAYANRKLFFSPYSNGSSNIYEYDIAKNSYEKIINMPTTGNVVALVGVSF